MSAFQDIAQPSARSAGQGIWGWLAVGIAGFVLLPWYALPGSGLFSLTWLGNYPTAGTASAFWQIVAQDRAWLLLPALPLLGIAAAVAVPRDLPLHGRLLTCFGLTGFALLLLQGFAIDHRGPTWPALQPLLPVDAKQPGLGLGAALLGFAYLMLFARGLARRGYCRSDAFTVGAITLIVALIGLFVFFPVLSVLLQAFAGPPADIMTKGFDRSIWGLDCLSSNLRCGVAWNTLFLAVVVGAGTTLLGLAFALIAVRTGFRFKPLLRLLTILPIITPPFVIGLALVLLFGRSGAVTALLLDLFDIPRSRWIYGFTGIAIAQLLAFTPIAFLVLIGVVQGIAPSLEEAAQTLRASRWTTFRTVTWPLLRPGIANAFLLGFVESLADFGNPLVLGGSYDVLSTKIFFAIVGAAHDESRAAILAIILLVFTLGAFWAQHHWLGNRTYTTVTGKGDSGVPASPPRRVTFVCYALALPWAAFTAVIYLTILFGGFVKAVGRDHSFTLTHYISGFAVEWGANGFLFTGSAWGSFGITLWISAISAPLTAGIGVLTAWLLTRQQFTGRRAFEFGTMLSFAIPGTVIGISYVLAFNVPPLELTGTGIILVICFIFRNMPVGVRAGIATLSQIDKSLDEASLTLGAGAAGTFRRIMLPLLRPAVVAALVYSFVRAMTAVSAIIFLVTAQYNMATAYIVGRVEAGELGLAIAYSTVLIAVMVLAIALIQFIVGERRLGRRSIAANPLPAAAG
jgi:iron(III) transport system permease protein